jgi:hypothetical protein
MHQTVAEMKLQDIEVEMAPEYAKEMVWQESNPDVLNNQVHVFGVQQNRIHRLLGQVDVIVTDAPLLHSIVYDRLYDFVGPSEAFHKLVYDQFSRLENVNIVLRRDEEEYLTNGRQQDLEEAREADKVLREVLTDYSVEHTPMNMQAPVDKLMSVIESNANLT